MQLVQKTAVPTCQTLKKNNIMPIIKYKNVDINIDSKVILENVSFTLEAGEFAYIIGSVGSGKSTLLKTIYGEVDITDGKAFVMDEYNMAKISNRKLQKLRRSIGIVFQDFQLLTDRSIHDNLNFVLRCTGWKDKYKREERIQEVLNLVGLPQKGYKRPHELSGGEQQRIVIARAILNRPALLLADEPTGNLDNETGRNIMRILHRISKEENMAVLMITHNEQWLKEFPGTVYRCKDMEMNKIAMPDSASIATNELPAEANEAPVATNEAPAATEGATVNEENTNDIENKE